MNAVSKQTDERIRLRQLFYGSFIGGVYMVQLFLATQPLDQSARVCVIAFSVAIPPLEAHWSSIDTKASDLLTDWLSTAPVLS